MREQRVKVMDLVPGDHVVSINGTAVGTRFQGHQEMPEDTPLVGPRGGSYTLTLHGTRQRIGLVLRNGRTVVVQRTSTAVVLRESEDW